MGMLFMGCQSEAPLSTSTGPKFSSETNNVDAAAIAGYERGRGCYILMWCAHCNDGEGEYVRQYIPCDDLRDAYINSEGEWIVPDSILQ